MAIARRDLLGIGAAAALTMAASACRAGTGQDDSAHRPPAPGASPHAVATSRIVGQPAPGVLYFGASVPYYRSLETWEQELGAVLGVNRSYFTPDENETAQLVSRCRDDVAHGRLPHVSVKPPASWREVAAGSHDDWLTGMFAPLAEEGMPIIFTLNHEPENDVGGPGMQPPDFVAMQRRTIRLAAEVAPLVLVVPVLQGWRFDPLRSDTDPSDWIVPDAPVAGVDVYNPWSPTNGDEWRSLGSRLDEVRGWLGDTPLVIGEYGCREDPRNPGLAAEWLRDAAEYARTHNVVAMSYYNSGRHEPGGSWELTGETEAAFAELLASEWVARLA
jgi:hypothetical protein